MTNNVLTILILGLLISTCACTKRSTNNNSNDIENASPKHESLISWPYDSTVKRNSQLVSLIEILDRYVREDYHKKEISDNLLWMQDYRTKLCEYYKNRTNDYLPIFIMADSVIKEATVLWNQEIEKSTQEMSIYDVEKIFLVFEQFNEYDKLYYNVCKTDEQKYLITAEFIKWFKLRDLFYNIYINCVDLNYWNGSIRGYIKTSGDFSILKSHVDLYKKEYMIKTEDSEEWDDTGVFLNTARNLLINCCEQALKEYYDKNKEEYQDDKRYHELYNETKILITKLPKQIDAWCETRQPWEDEMSTDWLRPAFSRNTSEVLIKMANIISTIQ